MSASGRKPAVARIWEGRTRAAIADTYAAYLSYWGSRDEIHAYAGADIDKTHHLPKDAEYLLELPPHVKHVDVLVDEWSVE